MEEVTAPHVHEIDEGDPRVSRSSDSRGAVGRSERYIEGEANAYFLVYGIQRDRNRKIGGEGTEVRASDLGAFWAILPGAREAELLSAGCEVHEAGLTVLLSLLLEAVTR